MRPRDALVGGGAMTHRIISECGSCGSGRLHSVLSLGSTPPTCSMLEIGDGTEQERYPLELLECAECSLVQLSCIVDPAIVFAPDYPYSSGNNGQLREHFASLAASLQARPDDLVVDVGANDGTFLANLDCLTVAVDPTWQVRRAPADRQIEAFFGRDIAEEILADHGPARYVTAMNVLAHVADPHDFLDGVRILLGDDGRFITENHDLASIAEGGQWDTVYHEHLRYYSPGSLAGLLERHGLHVYHEQKIATHGGSLRSWASTEPALEGVEPVSATRYDWRGVRETVKRTKWHLRSYISATRTLGKRIGALGATARGTTILGYCELDADDIEAVYEVEGSDKLGHYVPGTRIPVLDERALFEPGAPENLLLLSWHLADRLIPKLRDGGYLGTIILPLPRLRVDHHYLDRDLTRWHDVAQVNADA